MIFKDKRKLFDEQKGEILINTFMLFFIHLIFLSENYIFNGMILKRKEFVIQWRKFEIKRSCILRIMNF